MIITSWDDKIIIINNDDKFQYRLHLRGIFIPALAMETLDNSVFQCLTNIPTICNEIMDKISHFAHKFSLEGVM